MDQYLLEYQAGKIGTKKAPLRQGFCIIYLVFLSDDHFHDFVFERANDVNT
jgi:hypothetical protein